MRKSDYLKLSKERLAELLEERDMQDSIMAVGSVNQNITSCYAPGGYCTNPHKDCINCPKDWSDYVITTHDGTAGFKPETNNKSR